MSKRFTESTKWSDPWFQDLSRDHKLLWVYLCDNCDHAGVWKYNPRLANFQLGIELDYDEVLRVFGKRIHVLDSEKWFITAFIKFQYGELSDDCRPHKPILDTIKRHNLERVLKGYSKGIERDKDKTKTKTIQEEEGEPFSELPENLNNDQFREAWIRWQNYRKKKKISPLLRESIISQWKECSQCGCAESIEAIELSIRKGYQGFFPKQRVGGPVTPTKPKITPEQQKEYEAAYEKWCRETYPNSDWQFRCATTQTLIDFKKYAATSRP